MTIVLHHHPFTRAATVVWMLEELGVDYRLEHVDIMTGAHKTPAFLAKNEMGKLPVIEDGNVVVSETSAIGIYLADRYSPGTLAPALDDADRGRWLRWCVYPAAVIEPAAMAKAAKWEYRASNAGFGSFDDVVRTVHAAIGTDTDKPWLLGQRFTMADVIFGSTLRYMVRFKMFPTDDAVINAYVARLDAREACKRAEARNAAVIAERKLGG